MFAFIMLLNTAILWRLYRSAPRSLVPMESSPVQRKATCMMDCSGNNKMWVYATYLVETVYLVNVCCCTIGYCGLSPTELVDIIMNRDPDKKRPCSNKAR